MLRWLVLNMGPGDKNPKDRTESTLNCPCAGRMREQSLATEQQRDWGQLLLQLYSVQAFYWIGSETAVFFFKANINDPIPSHSIFGPFSK